MRLIDADALKKEVKTLFCPDGYKIMMLERIDSAPAVIKCSMTSDGLPLMDLRPRPQGEWVYEEKKISYALFGYYVCSVCGEHYANNTNFCPNCGAKMKGGAE